MADEPAVVAAAAGAAAGARVDDEAGADGDGDPGSPLAERGAASPGLAAAVVSPLDLSAVLSRIAVRQSADGGISIEAPREAAALLAALLGGLAQKLTETARAT